MDTFYLGTGALMSPLRRSRSRGAIAAPVVIEGTPRRRARSKSRPRALYQEAEVVPAATGKRLQLYMFLVNNRNHGRISKLINRHFFNRLHSPRSSQGRASPVDDQRSEEDLLPTSSSCSSRQLSAGEKTRP